MGKMDLAEEKAQALAEKIAFFAALDDLDKDDEGTDAGVMASMKAMMPAPAPLQAADVPVFSTPGSRNAGSLVDTNYQRPRSHVERKTPLRRSHTLPDHITGEVAPETVHVVKDTPLRPPMKQPQPPRLIHSVSVPSTISSSAPAMGTATKMSGKRKRSDPLVPEEQRVFAGLQMYYIPNNKIAKARRTKIEKAVQYGASWVQEWTGDVTHVVVDKGLSYGDVLKALRLSDLPQSLVLVNDEYPPDCISWKMLVDPTLPRFEVPGRPLVTVATPAPSQSEASQTSLQIKPVSRRDQVVVYDAQTASRTDEDSAELLRQQLDLEQETCAAKKSQRAVANSNDRIDNLDEPHRALKEAGATKRLLERPIVEPERRLLPKETSVKSTFNDPLQDIIAKARAIEHLPINSDDEDTSPHISTDEHSDSSSTETEKRRKPKTRKRSDTPTMPNFTCMNNSQNSQANPNAKTIEVLQEMANYYVSIQDHWRPLAYRKAIAQLRKQTTRISTKEEAESLPFVGTRLAAKIEEIVLTSRLRRLESTKLDPDDQTLKLFTQIYGVGHSQASKWLQKGYKTLDDLTANATLSENQKIGIAHYEDFLTRIPRAEVAQLGEIVRRALMVVDPEIQITIGGSYRRGSKDSGDIDLIVTKPGASSAYLRTIVLDVLVPRLFSQDFLTAALAVTSREDGSKWHGACHFPTSTFTDQSAVTANPWRRIDFLLVPYDEIGAAMVYFTGNDIFNRSMRLLARTKGMRLNQRGLFKDCIRGPGGKKMNEGVKVAGKEEREIFEILGVPWREAEERNC